MTPNDFVPQTRFNAVLLI